MMHVSEAGFRGPHHGQACHLNYDDDGNGGDGNGYPFPESGLFEARECQTDFGHMIQPQYTPGPVTEQTVSHTPRAILGGC
jgi:hypothetical protein